MRAAGRDTESGLRQLLNEWDPIGVADEARDEYDCMLTPLLHRLRRGADEAEISDFLRLELEDHFGLDPRLSDPERMAARLTSWWAATGQGHLTRLSALAGQGATRTGRPAPAPRYADRRSTPPPRNRVARRSDAPPR